MYEKEEQIVKLWDWSIRFEELINPTITSCMSKSTCKFVYLLCNFLDNIFKQLWYTRTDFYKCVLFISNIIHRFCLHLYVACPSVWRVGTWKMVWTFVWLLIVELFNLGIVPYLCPAIHLTKLIWLYPDSKFVDCIFKASTFQAPQLGIARPLGCWRPAGKHRIP